MSTMYSIGLMNQLGDALERAFFPPYMVTKLKNFPDLKSIKELLSGRMKLVDRHVIDCDADPWVPDGWSVEQHIKGGMFEWDPVRVALRFSDRKKYGEAIGEDELHRLLADKLVLNENVRQYLQVRKGIIPQDCDDKILLFPGTIYRSSDGRRFIATLFNCHDRWGWQDGMLRIDPAAVRVSE